MIFFEHKYRGGDYNTDILGLYNTYILTAITPKTLKYDIVGMTAITPDTLKFWISEILSAWFRPSGVKALSSSNFGKNYGHWVIFSLNFDTKMYFLIVAVCLVKKDLKEGNDFYE